MALLTARELGALAREALAQAGARGFVRFLPEGSDALLLTDAPRFADARTLERLACALRERGFDAPPPRDGLLAFSPGDALIMEQADAPPVPPFDWDGPLAPAFSLADRWLRAPDAPLSAQGRRLFIETARCLRRPEAEALRGLSRLRALSAQMQRERAGGLRPSGSLLGAWCAERAAARGGPTGSDLNAPRKRAFEEERGGDKA